MPTAPFNHKLIKISKRQYRNPIYLAKEWQGFLDGGECSSLADLASYLQVSRARVTQIMNLLHLSLEAIDIVYSLGDPLRKPLISERRLRPLLGLVAEKQIEQIKQLLSGVPFTLTIQSRLTKTSCTLVRTYSLTFGAP